MHMYQSLEGPEFLEAVAKAEEANCNDVNAAEYYRRSKEWSGHLQALAAAQQQVQDLQDRLRHISERARV